MTVELFGSPFFWVSTLPYIVRGPMADFRQIWVGGSVQGAPLAAVVPCEMA